MEFTTTEKLIRCGYIYLFKKMLANDVSCWECILRRKGAQCNASTKLSATDEFIGHNNDHTHPPSQTEVEITKVKAIIKRKAESTVDTRYIIKKRVGRGRCKSAFSRYTEKKYPTCSLGSGHATTSSGSRRNSGVASSIPSHNKWWGGLGV